ncbi:MAG: 2-oxo acid dehydrogenase subunit E2 [Actinobacteria bacterium]|nr:2-oxo acid dehydrogenase subunit E2 [Actinomycetota bacterium]
MAYEFKFPDIGEGITEGEILSWKVQEGDVVVEDQTLAELETDKAVVEMPSPKAGRIVRLHAAEGDIVAVGSVLVTIEDTGTGAAEVAPARVAAPAGEAAPVTVAAPAGKPQGPAVEQPYSGSVVGRLEEAPEEGAEPPEPVGGPAVTPPTPAAPAAPATPPAPAPAVGPPAPPAPAAAPTAQAAPAPAPEPASGGPAAAATPPEEVLALPSVRALAKELGVDITKIRGTGTGGRILKQDVEDLAQVMAYGVGGMKPAAAAGTPTQAEPTAAPAQTPTPGGIVEQDPYGAVERVPFRGVRRTMAKRMRESVSTQAQVTAMDQADVTVIRHIREKEREVATERGVHLTYLAFAIKACTAALKRFPRLNASLAESGEEYVVKRYYNVGIAVDTRSGLVVPNIKQADRKSIFGIAEEIIELVKKAEDRTLDLADLHGGTFTITNYGAIGGTYATPIVYYPEVAILGMGRIGEIPVVREGQVVPRLILPLSLTFDHRLIDGAEAARFLNTIVGYLEDPDLLLLEGA